MAGDPDEARNEEADFALLRRSNHSLLQSGRTCFTASLGDTDE
jgi:hypothetical protein